MKGLDLGIYIISTICGIFTVSSSFIIAYYQRKLQKEIYKNEQVSTMVEDKINLFDKRYNVFIDYIYLFRLAQLLGDDGDLDIKTFEEYTFNSDMFSYIDINPLNHHNDNFLILTQKLNSIAMGEFCFPEDISQLIADFKNNFYGYLDNYKSKSKLYRYSKEEYAAKLRNHVVYVNDNNIIEEMRNLIKIKG
ncbi:hypothetical protein [Clostridium sp. AWRP]|uniref:hypothetical protein n=1 Tax=Clostridium sp. AWRP TaxID=2212991 RepID=UPI000FD9D93B|nr:hypothetical protein [Clostridium sp. AWRP]AZV55934.1 hypothetical protein DMR38_04565 [Clostridium sp. AWRP]